jgi:hypothetical protein
MGFSLSSIKKEINRSSKKVSKATTKATSQTQKAVKKAGTQTQSEFKRVQDKGLGGSLFGKDYMWKIGGLAVGLVVFNRMMK